MATKQFYIDQLVELSEELIDLKKDYQDLKIADNLLWNNFEDLKRILQDLAKQNAELKSKI